MKHYSSKQRILLVGEGDFSFSVSLANGFGGSAKNMVATSLDSRGTLMYSYSEACENLKILKKMGCTIIHEVDVVTMSEHPRLSLLRFDVIVFNFPHAGFIYGDERYFLQIELHRALVKAFFWSASKMLTPNGEVHVRHKTNYPFSAWGLEESAENEGLCLHQEFPFSKSEYPGYMNKRGAGPKCDKTFPIQECSLYKFVIRVPRDENKLTKECNDFKIEPQQTLVSGVCRCACDMPKEDKVTLGQRTSSQPYCKWDIEGLAKGVGLSILVKTPFQVSECPGCGNRQNDGPMCRRPIRVRDTCVYELSVK